GLTAIHALSFGCPIITHNNFSEQMPEFEAIKPSKTGYFYQQGDVADLKDKIRKVISADEKTRKEVREEAFKE
ncbi:glycosyltransferase, partial [Acinetobacter sp. 163]|nr:glycosyltransferase [Acinetobacter sp. 163]